MTGGGGAEIDRVLAIVVGEINSLAEPQAGGPPVTLTLGGSVVNGTIIPDWQWFDEVEHAARAGFTVHTGGSIDDEHGGWARLFGGVSESLTRDREERRVVQNLAGGLSERYRRLLAEEDRASYIHLNNARVLASGVGLLQGGMHWRGRLSAVSGWSFGHLDEATADSSSSNA
jgi:hypothetical protein